MVAHDHDLSATTTGTTDRQDASLLIAGRRIADRERRPIVNPATEAVIGSVACATAGDLDDALAAAERGFELWRRETAVARGAVLARAAALIRTLVEPAALALTREQGKPLAQSRLELTLCAETFDWYAAEAGRAYGRLLPPRTPGARHLVVPEPVGPVAAFSPWNFPALLAARKIAPALAAGCSIVVKPPEEAPSAALMLGTALLEAGLPPEALGIVYGDPAAISGRLIPSPVIRKISFTGSVPVGKALSALAGQHAKSATMELGGHAPVIVFADADIAAAGALAAIGKTRNAGQVCTSPTRFYVERPAYDAFLSAFAKGLEALSIGDGTLPGSDVGPLANARRLQAMEGLVGDAVRRGAEVVTGGARVGDRGYFWKPTILTGVPDDALVMTSEPFGPIATVAPFDSADEAFALANRSAVGLAGYGFTRSAANAQALGDRLQVGVVGINSFAVSHTEAPFGGVKDSGFGYEGGSEGLSAYLHHKYIHHA